MATPRRRFVEERGRRRPGARRTPAYRAITLGSERDDWGVYNAHGDLVYRGEAVTAAMVANRLTPTKT